MNSLPVFLRLTGQPVILLGEGEAAAAKRRVLERAGAHCVGEDHPGARIAIVALDDEDAAIAAVHRLKARGMLVNAVDRPALCDFTLPAIIDRDPVLIAIGTGGASAGLAKALRQRLEMLLPAGLGRIASDLANARDAMRARWPDAVVRRKAIDAALVQGGALDPLVTQPVDAVERWLADPVAGAGAGVQRLDISSDDPDQLTLAAARLLAQADVVVHAPRIAAAIVQRARADAVRLCSETMPDPLPSGRVVQLVWSRS